MKDSLKGPGIGQHFGFENMKIVFLTKHIAKAKLTEYPLLFMGE